MPILFYTVPTGVNDNVHIGIFHDSLTYNYTITLDEMNYNSEDLAGAIGDQVHQLEVNLRFACSAIADNFKMLVQFLDKRLSNPDAATFNMFDDAELEQGLY